MTPAKMYCLDCDYPLDQLSSDRCPECGREFNPDDPSTFRVRLSRPEVVYSARNQMQAHFLRDILVGEGILSEVRNESPAFSGVGAYQIRVASEDAHLAKEILQGVEELPTGDHPGEVWRCPNCGEEVDAHFQICWHCQTERPATADAEGDLRPGDHLPDMDERK